MKELWELFTAFCRIGGFTFGGGYAMLPMIQQEIVEEKKWATEEEVMNYYAIGQCTPGIIAVNVATFIGYKRKGVIGGIVATSGVVVPSFCIILVIAAFLENLTEYPVVEHAFGGIRVGVIVLILNAVKKLWDTGVKDITGVFIFLAAFLVSAFFDISPIWIVTATILLGLVMQKTAGKE